MPHSRRVPDSNPSCKTPAHAPHHQFPCRATMQQWSISALCKGKTPRKANASVVALRDVLLMFGGCDGSGAATNSLHYLELSGLAAGSSWAPVKTSGDAPSARSNASAFAFNDKLWVYGGYDGSAHLADLHCLDLSSLTWQAVEQRGALPDRGFKHSTFSAATLAPSAGCMLAFGAQPQDENSNRTARPAGSPALQLHALDLQTARWSVVPCTGFVSFSRLEAIVCHANNLIALGWSPAAAKADGGMQACSLDLSCLRASGSPAPAASRQESSRTPLSQLAGTKRRAATLAWQELAMGGLVPPARTSAAVAVLGNQLLLHGGLLCGSSVFGRLSGDAYCLDLGPPLGGFTWTRLAPSQERAASLSAGRASHSAVALPHVNAVVLVAGTNSRQAHASCDTMECLRLVQATAAAPADIGPTAPAMQDVLSDTPTLLGIQPFGHVTATPTMFERAAAPAPAVPAPQHPSALTAGGSTGTAPTPAVPVSASAQANAAAQAAAAAAPSSTLLPAFDFSAFFGTGALSDIELVAGNASFPAHRLLLCGLSPRFAQLIEQQAAVVRVASSGRECQQVGYRLALDDMYPDVLELMLQYMYCRLRAVPPEAAPLLFKAADRYGLSGLRAACLKVVIATLELDTVCNSVLLAHDLKCSQLQQACIMYAAASPERFQQMLATPGYLHLNQMHPRVGQMFVAAVTQLLMGRRR